MRVRISVPYFLFSVKNKNCDSLMFTSSNHSSHLRIFLLLMAISVLLQLMVSPFFFSLSSTTLFRGTFSFLSMSGTSTLSSAHLMTFRLRPPLYLFWSNYNILCLISMRNTKRKTIYRYMRIWEKYFFLIETYLATLRWCEYLCVNAYTSNSLESSSECISLHKESISHLFINLLV